MIPKTIYYVWVGGDKPPKIQECLESWNKYLSDFKIVELNESNIDFDRSKLIRWSYDNQYWSFVADCAKVYHAQNHPGIYLDADFQFIKPIPDSMLDTDGMFLAAENPSTPCVGIIGVAHRNNPVINRVANYFETLSTDKLAGKAFFVYEIRDILKEVGYFPLNDSGYADMFYDDTLVRVYSRDYFLPISWNEHYPNYFTDKTVAVHRWTGTALGDGNKTHDKFMKTVHKNELKAKKHGDFNFKNENQRIHDIMHKLIGLD